MRFLTALLILVLAAGCQRSFDPQAESAFREAQAAFDQAQSPSDYLIAAARFQEILDQGIESGALYYNQGNAYMRGGQRGRAIACYRQAQRHRPRDARLEANLQAALGTTIPRGNRPLAEYVFFWQDWISYLSKFRISLAAAGGTLLLALGGLTWNGVWWRRSAALMLGVTVVLAGSALYDWYRFETIRRGVVTIAEVMPRKGNAASYEPALTSPLREGAEFVVIEQRGEWMLVELAGGQEGWLKSTDVVTY